MEKNQQNHGAATESLENSGATGQQPGQQLPAGAQAENLDHPSAPEKTVQHSESSFPQKDNETLGTP